MEVALTNIHTEPKSYQKFIDLYHQVSSCMFEEISVELRNWFSANMSAVLGSVLNDAAMLNTVTIDSANQAIKIILQKNEFLAHYGYKNLNDTNRTTVPYLKLKPTESRYFQNYVLEQLLSQKEFPSMTDQLRRKIAESIYEIFVNAQIHSDTDYIYTCGQFFPKKHKIEFTIVDRGVGFKRKIAQRFSKQISSVNAIKWAIQDGNSTKIDISGGIGLAILKEFIQLNKGKFQIISDDGFFQLSTDGEETEYFSGSFPGTIVNMEFRTDDTSSYKLSSEDHLNDIF